MLLALNASLPTRFNMTLAQLMTRPHATPCSQWGLLCYDGKGCRSFLDYHGNDLSPLAHLLSHYPIHSQMVMARLACSQAPLAEAEPLYRESAGRYWGCSVDGELWATAALPTGRRQPVGESATERLFCHLLHCLEESEPSAGQTPRNRAHCQSLHTRYLQQESAQLLGLLPTIRQHLDPQGQLLLCNERSLLVVSEQPIYWQSFAQPAHYPGGHRGTIRADTQVTLIASEPLPSPHPWQASTSYSALVFSCGHLLARQ